MSLYIDDSTLDNLWFNEKDKARVVTFLTEDARKRFVLWVYRPFITNYYGENIPWYPNYDFWNDKEWNEILEYEIYEYEKPGSCEIDDPRKSRGVWRRVHGL